MSNFRQAGRAVRATSFGLTSRFSWRARPSPWAQLLWSSGGVVTVELDDGLWRVPPDRALWLPAKTPHAIRAGGRVALHAIYCNARVAAPLPVHPTLVARTSVLVAISARVLSLDGLDTRRVRDRHLLAVFTDEVIGTPREALVPSLPNDARALRAAELLSASPTETLARVAQRSGASLRTLSRLFRAETGHGVSEWRRRVWLSKAADALLRGGSVTSVALASGYDSISAFIAAFRQTTGVSPGQYASRRAVSASRLDRPPARRHRV
jgi:AraC-like DNA-binding protein